MLNPFIILGPSQLEKDTQNINGKRNARGFDRPTRQSAVWNQLTLRLGILLIRMGKELTGERTFQGGSDDPWFQGGKTKTRPA